MMSDFSERNRERERNLLERTHTEVMEQISLAKVCKHSADVKHHLQKALAAVEKGQNHVKVAGVFSGIFTEADL